MHGVQFRDWHVDLAECILRLLDFVTVADVAVLHASCPLHVEHIVDILERHREPLNAVGQLNRDR